jgi:signal transduction histidine kinase
MAGALLNLLQNAHKYSGEDKRIALCARLEGKWVGLSVEDNGVGIAPRDRKRIFERFYRVDKSRAREMGGTGLGLSIVKHVAAGHGGEATVWSSEGTGSTFTLRLPAAAVSEESA